MKYAKFLLPILVLALILSLQVTVQASPYAEERCGENATWQIDSNDTLIISGTGAVTSAPWYNYHRYSFDKVVIGEGITSLADQSFLHCLNLRQVTFPASLVSVGADCFYGCDYLQSVTYNSTLSNWQQIAFADKASPLFLSQLTCTDRTVNLCGSNIVWVLEADGNLSITGSGAMGDFAATAPAPWHELYSSIKTVTIAEGITTIGSFAFYNLDPANPFTITAITIPKSLVSIGHMAFSDCTLLTDVYYGDNYDSWKQLTIDSLNEMLQSITLHTSDRTVSLCGQATLWEFDDQGTLTIYGEGPTADWTGNTKAPWHSIRVNIENVVICEGITHLGSHAFEGNCVKKVTLADSVLSIGNYAFANSSLQQINVGSSLLQLREGAFEGCEDLRAIVLPDAVTYIGNFAFRDCTNLETATLGAGLTILGKEAFAGCTSLKEMVLADGLTTIDECTFLGCKAMKQILLPKNLQVIGGGAFQDCTALKVILLPESVKQVDYHAFRNCTDLTEIRIPAKVETFDPAAVADCLNLAAFRVDKHNAHYTSDSAGVLYNKEQTVLLRAPQALTGSYRIADSVIELNYQAFCNCAKLRHVEIPDSVTRLPEDVFYKCSSLETVDLSKNLTYIGSSAFWCCEELTEIALPETLTMIEMEAFGGCEKLKTINLHDNITYIGYRAFCFCEALETVTWPSGTTTIKESTFDGCIGLTEVNLPNTVTAIEHDAFYQCINLTRFTIPAGVTEFDASVLSFCGKLTDLCVDPANPNYMSDSRGVLFTKDKTTLLYAPGGLSGSYEIPFGTTTVVTLAFSRCNALTELSIPASVTNIESNAIYDNENLTLIRVAEENNNYASDDSGVLFDKEKTRLILAPDKLSRYYQVPDSVTEINREAFRFSHITSIYLPTSLIKIGWAAFCETPLEKAYYAGTVHQWWLISKAEGNDSLTKTTVLCESSYTDGLMEYCTHSFGSWAKVDNTNHGKTCAICQYVQLEEHSLVDGTVIKEATCKENGQMQYTCTVCSGKVIKDSDKSTDHSYGSWTYEDYWWHSRVCTICEGMDYAYHGWRGTVTTEPNCSTEGAVTYSCSGCGVAETETIPKTTQHTYGAWTEVNGTNHKRTCSVCTKEQFANHSWNSGSTTKKPSCQEEGVKTYTCTSCNAAKTESIAKLTQHSYDHACDADCNICGAKRTPSHTYTTSWNSDQTNHWRECTVCKDRIDVTAHTPGAAATATTAQSCTVCGYVIQPTQGHTHQYSTGWSADENGHFYSCSGCNEKSSYTAHEFENGCDPDCATCGYIRDTKHKCDEKWTVDAFHHWYICVNCGIKLEEAAHIPGEEATATKAQTCIVCNYEIVPALGESESPTDPTETPSVEEEVPATETETPSVEKNNETQWWIVAAVVCVIIVGMIAFVVIKIRFDE